MSYKTAADYKREQGPDARTNASRIRRMLLGVTSRVFWQLVGYKSHETKQPTTDAENFSGIGFYARPRSSDRAEAILASVADARHSVIVATRNEDVRKVMADLDEDETAIFTSSAIVIINADGTVEVRSQLGVAQSLANEVYRTAEDVMLTAVAALCTAIAGMTAPAGTYPHPAVTAAATAAATAITTFQAGSSTYLTAVLKGE